MQFSRFLVAAAAVALAQAVEFTNPSFNSITAGQPFNLTWTGAVGAVTLTLKDGPPLALVTVSTIASGLAGTSYIWNVPATLDANTYAIQIDDSTGVPNYSTQFQLIGGVTVVSSAAAATSSGASSSSASSASAATVTSTTASNSTATSSSKSSSTASKTSSSGSSSSGSQTSSATGSSSSTSAPSSASGLASPLAFVFLALAAFFTLN